MQFGRPIGDLNRKQFTTRKLTNNSKIVTKPKIFFENGPSFSRGQFRLHQIQNNLYIRKLSPLEKPLVIAAFSIHKRIQKLKRFITRAGDDAAKAGPNREPPNGFWRVFAAFLYFMPWIDVLPMVSPQPHIPRILSNRHPGILTFLFGAVQTTGIQQLYQGSEVAPMIAFFLIFLCVIKNTGITHFVRFHAMQAIMLDICTMLVQILRYFPPGEIRFSPFMWVYDQVTFTIAMTTILYCFIQALIGRYADLPYISEACYIQVELAEMM